MVLDLLAGAAAGLVIGLSLAAPPGPVNALIASRAVTRSWRSGFLVGCGAMTADAGFLALSVLAHSAVVGARGVLPYVALLGAAVMAYFAWGAARAGGRVPGPAAPDVRAHAASYATGLTVNATSPYPILWWLTAGLALVDRLRLKTRPIGLVHRLRRLRDHRANQVLVQRLSQEGHRWRQQLAERHQRSVQRAISRIFILIGDALPEAPPRATKVPLRQIIHKPLDRAGCAGNVVAFEGVGHLPHQPV